MSGRKFGRREVVGLAESRSGGLYWLCRCECGREDVVSGTALRGGRADCCENCRKISHGHAAKGKVSATYRSWASMIQRCTNKNNPKWINYGGRGISVCDRWMKFENFVSDMGERPGGASVDRIDNNRGYEPGNCRWATPKQQAANTRRNIWFYVFGKYLSARAFAEAIGESEKNISKLAIKGKVLVPFVRGAPPVGSLCVLDLQGL